MSNLSYIRIWKGNYFLSKDVSKTETLGTLNMSVINNGDILYLLFLSSNGKTGAVALSTIYKHHEYFTAIVSVEENVVCTIKFRFDSDGKFYCEAINSNNNSPSIHILEIVKLSSTIIKFS